jgi:hypothetical protein
MHELVRWKRLQQNLLLGPEVMCVNRSTFVEVFLTTWQLHEIVFSFRSDGDN